MLRRVVQIVLGVLAIWLVALAICDIKFEGRTVEHTADRIGETLHGRATIGEGDLALVRGRIALDQIAVRRDDAIGKLALDLSQVRCALPPLGLAFVDRECRELAIRGLRLEMSTAAVFQFERPKRPPFRAQRIVVEDAELIAAPSAFLPDLGQIRIRIERAVAGPTVFRTPASFMFQLRELRARVEMPDGIALDLDYGHGVLAVSGSVFGSTPVRVPVALPVADAADDPRAELAKLVQFGRDLTAQLVARRADDWLRSTLGL